MNNQNLSPRARGGGVKSPPRILRPKSILAIACSELVSVVSSRCYAGLQRVHSAHVVFPWRAGHGDGNGRQGGGWIEMTKINRFQHKLHIF